jgi:hypothetical protein
MKRTVKTNLDDIDDIEQIGLTDSMRACAGMTIEFKKHSGIPNRYTDLGKGGKCNWGEYWLEPLSENGKWFESVAKK